MNDSFLAIYGINPDGRTLEAPSGGTETGLVSWLVSRLVKLLTPGIGWSMLGYTPPSPPRVPTKRISSCSSAKQDAESMPTPISTNMPIESGKWHRIDFVNNCVGDEYVYQIPIPSKQASERRLSAQRWHNSVYGGLRMLENVGLREWEWTCGEPFYEDADNDSDEAIEFDSCEKDAALGKLSYRKRVEAFTYTRADDPICKSRKIQVCVPRQNVVVWSLPDYGDEIDEPEYVPPSEKKYCKRKVRPIKSRTSDLCIAREPSMNGLA